MIPVTLMAKTISVRPLCLTGMWSVCTMWHPATHVTLLLFCFSSSLFLYHELDNLSFAQIKYTSPWRQDQHEIFHCKQSAKCTMVTFTVH